MEKKATANSRSRNCGAWDLSELVIFETKFYQNLKIKLHLLVESANAKKNRKKLKPNFFLCTFE